MAADEEVDAVIVGGGAAGLTALRDLQAAAPDWKCALVEARRELGGRVRCFWPHESCDAGAAWVHGTESQASVLVSEAHACGVELVKVCRTNPWCDASAWREVASVWRPGGRRVEDAALVQAAREWQQFLRRVGQDAAAKALAAGDADSTLEAELGDETSPLARMHGDLLVLWMGASLDALQVREFADVDSTSWGDQPGPHALPAGGMRRVLSRLESNAMQVAGVVRLSATVDRVSSEHDVIRIEYRQGDSRFVLKARAVILTLPLGVLQRCADHLFHPPLPTPKREAIDRLGVGAYAKVFLIWHTAWWTEVIPKNKSFVACLDDTDRLAYVFLDHHAVFKKPILEATVAGTQALVFERLKPNERADQCVACLRRTFGDAAVPEIRTFLHTSWSQDPHARGAYSYWRRGAAETDVDELARSLEDAPLFFAGEATSLEYQGSLVGAMESGRRAAHEVLARLQGT